MKEYYAHRNDAGDLQPLSEHLDQVAEMAAEFASFFASEHFAALLGKLHDLGKASGGFERRLFYDGPKVDHSTLGAQALNRQGAPLLAYPVAGHHGGMPDGGAETSAEERVLARRFKKTVAPCEGKYVEYLNFSLMHQCPLKAVPGSIIFSSAFWIRMLYSCLVDADFIDTENFMLGKQPRKGSAEVLFLQAKVEEHVQKFKIPKTSVHRIRNGILEACKRNATRPPGLFSLTVPTGGGKTLSSLSFALDHAKANNLRRVIYCMPYTSIIEQNGGVFRDIVGEGNVLMHYADAFLKTGNESDEDDGVAQKLAAENWDHNLIMTTNVQFFESLFANKPSKCRKLHNIAKSVIVLDEAQMLPRDYMRPTIRAIEELCLNYGCTVVLMSATQPSLSRFFTAKMPVMELNPDIDASFSALKRIQIQHQGSLDLRALADQLKARQQVFCVVNTKQRASELFALVQDTNSFHLSTLMLPSDREETLNQIRSLLEEDQPCRVVATSMIEVGVDFDFPTGYREEAGLDSIIQAAGRVNREGKKPFESSFLYVFRVTDAKLPAETEQAAAVTRHVFDHFDDVTSPEAIRAYFERLFDVRDPLMDKEKIMELLDDERGWSIPFETIARRFRLINKETVPIFIPRDDYAKGLAHRLRNGERNKEILRQASAYCVNISPYEFEKIKMALQPLSPEDNMHLLDNMNLYSPKTGLSVRKVEGGAALLVTD